MTRQYGERVAVKDYSRTRLINSSIKLQNAGAARQSGSAARQELAGARRFSYRAAPCRRRKELAGDDYSLTKS